jgi:hypothetical protein
MELEVVFNNAEEKGTVQKGFVGNYKCRKMENGKMDDVSNRK